MASKPLQSYHRVWLDYHPERTEEWLRERLAEGFHIHHVDGDARNDSHLNLVLIEGGDHFMLHNGKKRRLFKAVSVGPKPETLERGKVAYNARVRGFPWDELGGQRVASNAKTYALHNSLPWPITTPRRPDIGEAAYLLRRDTDKYWKDIAILVGYAPSNPQGSSYRVQYFAKDYAEINGLEWPIPIG